MGTAVLRYGVHFVNVNTSSNLNKDPILYPDYWMAVKDGKELLRAWSSGRVILGESTPIHEYSNALYQQYFPLGTHRFGGVSGVTMEAFGVHLDGQAVGASTLSDIVEEWHLKNVWAPGSIGARTLVDHRGAVMRGVDASGGQADAIAERLEDQMQGHWHETYVDLGAGASNVQAGSAAGRITTFIKTALPQARESAADGTNGTPRTGLYTRDKSVTVGVPYMVVMIPAS